MGGSTTSSTSSIGAASPYQSSEALLIAVMGLTGAGKSTFVQAATGDENAVIGYELKSQTHEIMEFPCQINNQTVLLVDMPGFDDTDIPDADIFTQTTEWLRQAYTEDRKFSAILYLHRITDNRMAGSAMRNLLMFTDLCGKEFFSDVMLVSTLWDRPPTPAQNSNYKQLISTPSFWGNLKKAGAQDEKFYNYTDPKSAQATKRAHDILKLCLKNKAAALQVQEEMVNQKLTTDQTTAGRQVNFELNKVKAANDKLVADLKAQANKAQNEWVKKALEQEQALAQAKADAAEANRKLLASYNNNNNNNNNPSSGTGTGPSSTNIANLLVTAVKNNNTREARRLIHTNKANTNTSDSRGRTVLGIAVEKNQYDMVQLLLENGARASATDRRGSTSLHTAARYNYVPILRKLIDAATSSLNKKDSKGHTALYVACDNNNERAARALLDNGAKVNTRSNNDNTPLHAAARRGAKDLCKMLVNEYNADVTAENENGRTAARVAERNDHPNTASWLYKCGG